MLEKIISFSIQNRLFILLFAILLIGVGLFSLSKLPIDAVPDVTNVQVQILTKSPALGPLEVEQFITYPIEMAMNGIPDVEEIRSVSRYGISAVTVVFKEHVNIYFARQLVQERLQEAKESIPESFGSPEMGPASTGLGEIYHFALVGKDYSAMELRTLLDWDIANRLKSVPGVVEVNAWGGFAKQYEIAVDPRKLLSHKITLKQVFEAVTENNAVAGSAGIEHFQEQLLIRGEGLITGIKDVEEIIVATKEKGTPIRVKDLAKVREGHMPRLGSATQDGEAETVIGMVQMLIGENSRVVAKRVDEKVKEIQKSLPPGVEIKTFYDRTALVDRTLHTVQKNLLEGGLLVIAVLFILLGNFRAGLLVALVIPLSMLFAFTGMVIGKISGNLMSLGAIDFGLIVDGAVIMIENCVRRLSEEQKRLKRLLNPEERQQIIREASYEVRRATMFGELIIMIVYLPILTLQGTEGKMFRPMAFTVILALTGAMILTLTVVPAFASLFLGRKFEEKEFKVVHNFKGWYERTLDKVLRKPRKIIIAASLSFLASLAIFPFLGGEFIPSLDEGDIAVQAWRLPSISMASSVESTLRIEKVLKRFPEVLTVVSRTGSPEIATDVMGIELSDIFVILRPKKYWKTAKHKNELVEKMSEALNQEAPGIGFGFTQPIEMRFNELIAGVRSDIAVKLFGPDLEVLHDKGEEIIRVLSKIKGARDVKAEQVEGLPFLRIIPDRKEVARYGMNIRDVLFAVEAIHAGHIVGTAFEGTKRFPIAVKFDFNKPPDISAIENIPIYNEKGIPIPLGQIAKIFVDSGPAQISREFGQRKLVMELNVRGRDIESFVQEAQRMIESKVKLPAEYYLEWGGTFEELNRGRMRLMIVVPIALFVIFVLLYMALGSFRNAFMVFSGIPLSAIGGILSLLIWRIPFSISAGVGFIALFGVAVLNGLVMISFINRLLHNEKLPLEQAIKEGAMKRFRPVMMTALVASLGFLPMALSHGAGAEVQRPLATVVIGGLISSTFLTLFVLPALYLWFGRRKNMSPNRAS
jgi:heavy metal efflux system protein